MIRINLRRAGIAVAGVTALSLSALVPSAHADYAPQPNDIVGVGGDTPQFALQFGADGDSLGHQGFNSADDVNRLVYFDATADGNGRQSYADGSTLGSPKPLNPTVVLRAGTSPVQRPQSSGDALNALINDSNHEIDFVASASEPTSAQQNLVSGGLHVVQLATDSIRIVASNTTNAPAGLSAKDLVGIYDGTYTKWNQIPGNSAGSSDSIVPLLPPASSSITKTFTADLKAANGGTAPSTSAAQQVEQNDPSAIDDASTPADAIVPFSAGRLALYNKSYFNDPSTKYPSTTKLTIDVKALTGAPPVNSADPTATDYNSTVNDYVIYRESDENSATPFEPGSSLSWVQTLFSNPGGALKPFFDRTTGEALLTDAGVTPAYHDLGDVSSG